MLGIAVDLSRLLPDFERAKSVDADPVPGDERIANRGEALVDPVARLFLFNRTFNGCRLCQISSRHCRHGRILEDRDPGANSWDRTGLVRSVLT